MPFYEFECERCHVVTESFEEIGTKTIPCPACNPDGPLDPKTEVHAQLILSPTMTTFRFASGRKDL